MYNQRRISCSSQQPVPCPVLDCSLNVVASRLERRSSLTTVHPPNAPARARRGQAAARQARQSSNGAVVSRALLTRRRAGWMLDARWQPQHSGDESSAAHVPYVPHDRHDEVESGQRQHAARQQRPRRAGKQAKRPAAPWHLRNSSSARFRLLKLLLVALSAVLLVLLFLTVALPAWQTSALSSRATTHERTLSSAEASAALQRAGIVTEALPNSVWEDGVSLQQLVAFYAALSTSTAEDEAGEQLLVVQVAHGLSNRIRAFASALLFAHHYRLALRLIWLPDHHCRAAFTDLFLLSDSPLYQADLSSYSRLYPSWQRLRPEHICEREECAMVAQRLSDKRFDVYRYIDSSGQALDSRAYISPPAAGRSVFVHASTRLNHSLASSSADPRSSSRDHLYPALLVLQPSDAVSALLAAFDARYDGLRFDYALGLHIRELAPEAEMDGLRPNEYSAAMWAGLAAARRASSVDAFAELVHKTVTADPEQLFYVAADTPAAIARLREQYGEQRFVSVRDVAGETAARCDGGERGVECVQLALADQLLLARCGWIHGSVWSSFSEVAGMWRMSPVIYPPGAQQMARDVADNTTAAKF